MSEMVAKPYTDTRQESESNQYEIKTIVIAFHVSDRLNWNVWKVRFSGYYPTWNTCVSRHLQRYLSYGKKDDEGIALRESKRIRNV